MPETEAMIGTCCDGAHGTGWSSGTTPGDCVTGY